MAAGSPLLKGVRVLDLTWGWAGPASTLLLADLGAEVIKVEAPNRPDWWRSYTAGAGGLGDRDDFTEYSARFNSVNQGKLGILLDLGEEHGRRALRQLVCISDVVLNNFSTRVMQNLDLSFETLRGWNPQIVSVNGTIAGLSGPLMHHIGYAGNIQALSGVTALNHYADEEAPIQLGVPIGDPVFGLFLALASLLGLKQRSRAGVGVSIDLSAVESSLLFFAPVLARLASAETQPIEAGVPETLLRCEGTDSWVVAVLADEHDWLGVAAVVGRQGLPDAGEAAYVDILLDEVRAWSSSRSTEAVCEALRAQGIVSERSSLPSEVLEDQHLKDRGFFRSVHREPNGTHWYPGGWIRYRGALAALSPAPRLGEHTTHVLRDLVGLVEGPPLDVQ